MAACSGRWPGSSPTTKLHALFPAQAPRVLAAQSEARFAAGPEGFSVRPPAGLDPVRAAEAALARSLTARLPTHGDDAILFETPDGFSVRVRELGARGEGSVEAARWSTSARA